MPWQNHFNSNDGYWRYFRPYINALPDDSFPSAQCLNQLIPTGLETASGQAVQFVDSTQLTDDDYERRIYHQGIVSTRPDCWHDFFNAMVWLRFPQIKVAINALHNRVKRQAGKRGKLRDALTLFDECGVILVSSDRDFLKAASHRDWQQIFQHQASAWQLNTQIFVCGHAMLEKLLSPYKSMTAKALLVHTDPNTMRLPHDELLVLLDHKIAQLMLAGEVLTSPPHLSPLPLAGIPGWHWQGQQDDLFYADTGVFRPPPESLKPAPIFDYKPGLNAG